MFPGVVYLVGVVRAGPTPSLQGCVRDVATLLLLSLPAHLLLPAALDAGGVASELHVCQVTNVPPTFTHRPSEENEGEEESVGRPVNVFTDIKAKECQRSPV